MKTLPVGLALIAIGASGFAIPPKSVPDRTKTIPLPKPIYICVDELALTKNKGDEFQESQIPEAVKMLNGKRVRIIGQRNVIGPKPVANFVFNGYTERGMRFPGIHQNLTCLPYFIPVTLKKGMTTSVGEPIEIEGRFVIRPTSTNGKLTYLYHIEDAVVRPTKQPDGYGPSALPVFLSPS